LTVASVVTARNRMSGGASSRSSLVTAE
jgi:hypothetical protein